MKAEDFLNQYESAGPPTPVEQPPTNAERPSAAQFLDSFEQQDPKTKAMGFFQSKGWTKEQSAGIVGNLLHESSLDPNAIGDSGNSMGLAQWNGDRRKGLQTLAQFKGEKTPSFETQLEYIDHELSNTERKAGDALKNTQTPEAAATVFSALYERPGKPMLENRIKYARALAGVESTSGESSTALSGAKRGLGVVMGAANAPFAFAMGGFKAAEEPGYNEMPFWKQVVTSFEKAGESAWDSIAKEGSFGADVNDATRAFTGKSVSEMLPESMQWASPSIEFLASLALDPAVPTSMVANMVQKIGTKAVVGELGDTLAKVGKLPEAKQVALPKGLADDLRKLEGLDVEEKLALRSNLLDILKARESQRSIDVMEQIRASIENKPKELPPGQGFEMVDKARLPEPEPILTPVSKSAKESAEVFANEINKVQSPEGLDLLKARLAGEQSASEAERIASQRSAGVESGKDIMARIQNMIIDTREAKIGEAARRVGDPPISQGVEEGRAYADRLAAARNRKGELKELYNVTDEAGDDYGYVDNTLSLYKKGGPTELRSAVGGAAGFEEDENGNITFDPTKALFGMAAGAAAVAGSKYFYKRRAYMKAYQEAAKSNPEWSKVAGSIADPSKAAATPGVLNYGRWLEFQQKWTDRFRKLKNLTPETYEDAIKFSSYKDVANLEFLELSKDLAPARDVEMHFRDLVMANRDVTRAKMIKTSSTKPNVPGATKVGRQWIWQVENPDAVTLQDAKAAQSSILADLKAKGKNPAEIEASVGKFGEWTKKNMLGPLHDGGFISDDAYKSILKNNDFYATFDIIDKLPADLSKVPTNLPSKEYFSVVNNKAIHEVIGTTKKASDPIEATMKKWLEIKAMVARNKVVSTFVDDAITNPNSEFSKMVRPVADSAKEFKAYQVQGMNPLMRSQVPKGEMDILSRFTKGEPEHYAVPLSLSETMKGLAPAQAPKGVQMLNSIFRSTATTLYLPFTIGNAMRDGLMAFTTSPVYRLPDIFGKYEMDWMKGLGEGLKHEFGGHSKVTENYLRSGGGFGWTGELRSGNAIKTNLFEKKLFDKTVTVIASPFKLVEKLSGAVELAPRLAVFERAQKVGKSAEEAAFLARKATIDFNKAGTATRVLNQYVPFLNARLQGRLQVMDALRTDFKNTAAKLFATAVVPGIGAWAYNRMYHSDLYDDIPEYVKQNYYTVITGTDKDEKGREVPKYFVIAKGDVGQVASNPIEYVLDKWFENDRASAGKFITNWLSDISPIDFSRNGEFSGGKLVGSLLPPIAKGVVQNLTNSNFYTGREIVPYYMQDKPPELQYIEGKTPENYVSLAKKWNESPLLPGTISPLKTQDFMSNIVAGYGREGLDPAQMLKSLKGRIVKTEGGAKEDRAWEVYKGIEQDYNYARAHAEELLKKGERQDAVQLLMEWNKELGSRLDKMEELGFKDHGKAKRTFSFTSEKIKNAIVKRKLEELSTATELEKRLGIGR